jgi:hypothetical protein
MSSRRTDPGETAAPCDTIRAAESSGPFIEMTGVPSSSQSVTVEATSEVTTTKGPYPGFGDWVKNATKYRPTGVGVCSAPTPAGA